MYPGPPGLIVNAEGVQHEKDVWGKPSHWVDYSGEIGGEKLGVAIFDYPGNSRPARWHVRAYGLFAANPFGYSVFTNDKSKDGSVKLDPGQSIHFVYRVVVHSGDTQTAGIAKLWDDFSKNVKLSIIRVQQLNRICRLRLRLVTPCRSVLIIFHGLVPLRTTQLTRTNSLRVNPRWRLNYEH